MKMDKEIHINHDDIKELAKMLSEITPEVDEIGMINLAMRITGLARQTIYAKVSKREMPHMKQGKFLYFSKNELLQWIRDGRKPTKQETIFESEGR